MAITLLVKTPFTVDYADTIATQMLHVNGGSILNTLTNYIHNDDKKSVIELPFSSNYVYWNIFSKSYSVSELDNLENTESKLLFRVQKIDGQIAQITYVPDGQYIENLDEIQDTFVNSGASLTKNEQNIMVSYSTGNTITTSFKPKEIINIYIAYYSGTEKIHFGSLDLENIKEISEYNVIMNYNLVKAVSKKLGLSTPLDSIIIDITYTY